VYILSFEHDLSAYRRRETLCRLEPEALDVRAVLVDGSRKTPDQFEAISLQNRV